MLESDILWNYSQKLMGDFWGSGCPNDTQTKTMAKTMPDLPQYYNPKSTPDLGVLRGGLAKTVPTSVEAIRDIWLTPDFDSKHSFMSSISFLFFVAGTWWRWSWVVKDLRNLFDLDLKPYKKTTEEADLEKIRGPANHYLPHSSRLQKTVLGYEDICFVARLAL